MKIIVFLLSLFLATAAPAANTINFVTHLGDSYTSSAEISTLIEEFIKDSGTDVTLEAREQGLVYRYQDNYLFSHQKKALPVVQSAWQNNKKSSRRFQYLETSRSLMILPDKLPQKLRAYIENKMKGFSEDDGYVRYWSDLRFGQGVKGKIDNSKLTYATFEINQWKVDTDWHYSFYLTYKLKIDGHIFEVVSLAKTFGGIPRIKAVIDQTTKTNHIIVSSGNITPNPSELSGRERDLSDFDSIGRQYVLAGFSEILAKYTQLEAYNKLWDMNPPLRFFSSNIYLTEGEKQTRLFEPYKIINMNGLKIGLIGLTSPEMKHELKPYRIENPWLEKVVIKDATEELNSGILKELRQKSDLIVLVSNLSDEEEGKLRPSLFNIDLLMTVHGRMYSIDEIKSSKVQNFRTRLPTRPMFDIPLRMLSVNHTSVTVDGTDLNIVSRDTMLSQEIALKETNKSYNEQIISFVNQDDPVLPDHRMLKGATAADVTKFEFAKLAAEILRRGLDAEIGIFNIQNQSSDLTGEINSTIVKTWIRPEEQLALIYLRGSDLKTLLEENSKHRDDDQLVFAGIDENGNVSGIQLQPNEFYKVVTSTIVSENPRKYPSLANTKDRQLRFIIEGKKLFSSQRWIGCFTL